jgi:hypothetical protein
MENIFWVGYTHRQRNDIIQALETAIAPYGNITDFTFFSHIAITLKIELEEKKGRSVIR